MNYSSDKTTLILLSLLKAHRIRYVIASPGTTNLALVGSMQSDPFFQIFSAPDERSAAYMACGLSAESGEPVILSCTEATASRNYLPALTEAYYRKLPILVITGHHGENKIGHLIPQTIDRRAFPNDVIKLSVSLTKTKNSEEEWANVVSINKAILELDHHGKGPVHINLITAHRASFNIKELPSVRKIIRFTYPTSLPEIPNGRIGIFIGSHTQFSQEESFLIDKFCEQNDSVAFCDNTSGYKGKYCVNYSLVACQQKYVSELLTMDLLIHFGEISGDTYVTGKLRPKSVWRVNPDGEIRDTFKKLTNVFEMEISDFLNYYIGNNDITSKTNYYDLCIQEYDNVYSHIPEIEFSNIWIAKELSPLIPPKSIIHFGIYHSLRSWNFFKLPNSVVSTCNVGGFGIDGSLSTLLGSSLANPHKIHYLVVGDLAFFYDMNSIGNRHVQNNIRIMLMNNGRGIEFRKLDHPASKLGEKADDFVAAAGHYGKSSEVLVKHYAEDLGFMYLKASGKDEFIDNMKIFVSENMMEKPIVFEVFLQPDSEINTAHIMRNLVVEPMSMIKKGIKVIGAEIHQFLK